MIKQIKIGKKIIKIKVVQKIPGERKSTLGVFDPGDRIIYIKKHDRNEMVYTLLHEIMHAYIWNKSLHTFIKPNVEELVCDIFADSAIDMVNNPDMLAIIQGVKDGKKE